MQTPQLAATPRAGGLWRSTDDVKELNVRVNIKTEELQIRPWHAA